jgi:hypothetical protein
MAEEGAASRQIVTRYAVVVVASALVTVMVTSLPPRTRATVADPAVSGSGDPADVTATVAFGPAVVGVTVTGLVSSPTI